ncbi:MAG: 50S ribosomal protein L25/general stress protein Ctc [Bacteroidales bacterium]|nr:50S ribosomal protein L25/general stress protein Ctc [Bacteroidales bacterium]
MKTIEIKGTLRNELGKKHARQVRKAGNVPCIIYGKEKNINFSTHENNVKKLVFTPNAHLVDLNLDGEVIRAILHEIQFHPVTDRIMHADFVQVFADKPVTMNIPVTIKGDSVGVKAGGRLSVKKRHLKIKALAENLLDNIEIDVSGLKINDSVKVGNLKMDKLEFLDPKIATVVMISTSRVALKTEEEPEEEVAAGEDAEGTETGSGEAGDKT